MPEVKYDRKGRPILTKADQEPMIPISAEGQREREQFIAGLRAVADLLEGSPAIPLPEAYGGFKFQAEVETVEALRAAFHLNGPWEKNYEGDNADYFKEYVPKRADQQYDFVKAPFPVKFTVRIKREEVCVKRETGQRWVSGHSGYVQPATPGHYETTYEWDCI